MQGSRGWDGRAHPDSAHNDKYSLCIEGIDKIRNKDHSSLDCHIWMDYMSLNQDGNPVEELTKFDFANSIEWTDCVFTPLVDHAYTWYITHIVH